MVFVNRILWFCTSVWVAVGSDLGNDPACLAKPGNVKGNTLLQANVGVRKKGSMQKLGEAVDGCCSWYEGACGVIDATNDYCGRGATECANCDGEWCIDCTPAPESVPADASNTEDGCCSWNDGVDCGETGEYCNADAVQCRACNGEWCTTCGPPKFTSTPDPKAHLLQANIDVRKTGTVQDVSEESGCCSWYEGACGVIDATNDYCGRGATECADCDGKWCTDCTPAPESVPADASNTEDGCCSWNDGVDCGETSEWCNGDAVQCRACNGAWCTTCGPPKFTSTPDPKAHLLQANVDVRKTGTVQDVSEESGCCSWYEGACGVINATDDYCGRGATECADCDGKWCTDCTPAPESVPADASNTEDGCCSWNDGVDCGETGEYCNADAVQCRACNGEWCTTCGPPKFTSTPDPKSIR